MWLSETNHSPEEETSSRKFVITLSVPEGSEPIVRSCEIIGRGFRNRTSFADKTFLDELFIEEISKGLKECLANLGPETKVIAFQDFAVETPGLTLAGAHLMVTSDEAGCLHIIFRFRFFLGSLHLAFNKGYGFDEYLVDENSRLAALVISDLALPILNICEAAKSGMLQDAAPISSFGDSLAARAHEISFQIELLKRFVNTPESRVLSAANYALDIEEPEELRLTGSGFP